MDARDPEIPERDAGAENEHAPHPARRPRVRADRPDEIPFRTGDPT